MVEGEIVVLGATGNLGTYLVDQMINEGYEVVAVGYKNVNTRYYTEKGVRCASVNIAKKEDFEKLPNQGVRAVLLLSASMPAKMEGYNPQEYIDVNITGALNVLEYCKKIGVERFIYFQTVRDVFGLFNTGNNIPDEGQRSIDYTGDHAVYVISKCAAVDLIEHYHQEYGLKTIVFRLPTIYSYNPNMYMYVNGKKVIIAYRYLISKAIKGENIEIWGDPKLAKDYVYIKDFSRMVLLGIQSDIAQGFYNVATGKRTTIEEFILNIIEVFSINGQKSKVIYRPDIVSKQNSYFLSIDKSIRDLQYKPKYSIKKMLLDMKKEMYVLGPIIE